MLWGRIRRQGGVHRNGYWYHRQEQLGFRLVRPLSCPNKGVHLSLEDPTAATKYSLRSLAWRYLQLGKEVRALEIELEQLTRLASPNLARIFGVGPDTAARLLVAAGSNLGRLHSEAAFALLCGVSPIPASSGKTNRHRLNRGGDRQANAALHRIVPVRLRYDCRTKAYLDRRTRGGLSKSEIIRCLKRYVAREAFQGLQSYAGVAHTPA